MICPSSPPAFPKKPAKKKSEDETADYRRFVSPDYVPSARPVAMARQNPYGSSTDLQPEAPADEGQPPPDYYDRTSEAEAPATTPGAAQSSGRKKVSSETVPPVFLPGTTEFDSALAKVSPSTRKTLYELLRAEFKVLKVLPEKDPRRIDSTPPPENPPDPADET